MTDKLPHYDEQLDLLLDHVIHRTKNLIEQEGTNYHYRALLKISNQVSLILSSQKNVKRKTQKCNSPMDWQSTQKEN